MDYVWEIISPWVAAIGGVTGAGTIIYAVVRLLMGRFVKKTRATLDAAFNAEKVSQLTAEKLAGKTLNIDVTAVTEKALKKTAAKLDLRVEKVEVATNALKSILVAMGKGIIKLKALTDEEKAELASAIVMLESEYKPPEPTETMTIILEPVSVADDDETEETDSGVNFGGLDE